MLTLSLVLPLSLVLTLSLPECLPSHWEVKVGSTSMEEMWGTGFAGSSPPSLGRERAAVDVDVCPERRSPRYHETCLALESVEESARR